MAKRSQVSTKEGKFILQSMRPGLLKQDKESDHQMWNNSPGSNQAGQV